MRAQPSAYPDPQDLIESDKTSTSDTSDTERKRGMWNFLTWSFFLAQAAAAGDFFGGAARANDLGDSEAKSAAAANSAAQPGGQGALGKVSSSGEQLTPEDARSPFKVPSPNPQSAAGKGENSPALQSQAAGDDHISSGGAGGGGGSGSLVIEGDSATLIAISATRIDITLPGSQDNPSSPIQVTPDIDLPNQVAIDLGLDTTPILGNIIPPVTVDLGLDLGSNTNVNLDAQVGNILDLGVQLNNGLGIDVGLGNVIDLDLNIPLPVDQVVGGVLGFVDNTLDTVTSIPVLGGLTNAANGLVDETLDIVTGTVNTTGELVGDTIGDFTNLVGDVLNIGQEPLAIVPAAADVAASTVQLVENTAGSAAELAGDTLELLLNTAGDNLAAGTITQAVDTLADTAMAPLTAVSGIVNGVSDLVEGASTVAQAADAVTDVAATPLTAVSGVVETVAEVGNGASHLVTDAVDAAPVGTLLESLGLVESEIDVSAEASASGIGSGGLLPFLGETVSNAVPLDLLFQGQQYTDLNLALQSSSDFSAGSALPEDNIAGGDSSLLGNLLGHHGSDTDAPGNPNLLGSLLGQDQEHGLGRSLDLFP